MIPAEQVESRFQKKIGEWNQGKIVVRANKTIEHWLNGFKVVEYVKGSGIYKVLLAHSKYSKNPAFATGEKTPILLQDHNNSVYFRNIKIRELN